jgi:lipoprotein LpqH
MNHGFVVAVGGAVIVVAGMAGCSSQQAGGVTQGVGSGGKVVIDGQDQNVQGNVMCQTTPSGVQIGIGQEGVAAQMTGSDPLTVQQASPGKVNGVTLVYQNGNPMGGGTAQATKNGKSYTITGTATGIDPTNPMQPLSKPFEIDVTCP